MPTIEIVCLEQKEPLDFSDFSFSFALRAESEPISHRGLFAKELKRSNGCIYHFGNPEMRSGDSWFYASHLLDWNLGHNDHLKFLPEFIPELRQLFIDLLSASPVQRLSFSSDYQFGPQIRRHSKSLRYEEFWRRHAAGELWLNARYFIRS